MDKNEQVVWLAPGQSSEQRSKLHNLAGFIFEAEALTAKLIANQNSNVDYADAKNLEQTLAYALINATDLKKEVRGE
ncbi:hypothetical protein [Limosilactobacillus equigenerosi]|uniref:Uncharacterized protein n=1 Tax=Limosilactobacillus equigenerosi DSM 18793 = JCM 14505 TaxID=1423742 RepID=A0A0R1UPP3_9LACO|nr:hypothetical protein [Limosilactobacillus equigenerosi]KRL95193.1 hypothetical protein FC21_GL000780 [Limosilactobacillus equigenerosi DSM 18793 = JCM 14505]